MNINNIARGLILTVIVFVNIGCDQVSKIMVRESVELHSYKSLISNNLALTNVENEGAFLSLGSNFPPFIKDFVLLVLPALLLILALGYIIKKNALNKWMAIAIACIVGGGIGNLIDRFLYGSVTDFLHIKIGFLQTGIFNFADISITVGIGLLIVLQLLEKKEEVPV